MLSISVNVHRQIKSELSGSFPPGYARFLSPVGQLSTKADDTAGLHEVSFSATASLYYQYAHPSASDRTWFHTSDIQIGLLSTGVVQPVAWPRLVFFESVVMHQARSMFFIRGWQLSLALRTTDADGLETTFVRLRCQKGELHP